MTNTNNDYSAEHEKAEKDFLSISKEDAFNTDDIEVVE